MRVKTLSLSYKQLELCVLIYITLSHFSNPSCSKLTSSKCLENTTILFCLFSYCLKDHQAAGGHATCLIHSSHCLLPKSTSVRGGIGALVINRQQLILMTKNKEWKTEILFFPPSFHLQREILSSVFSQKHLPCKTNYKNAVISDHSCVNSRICFFLCFKACVSDVALSKWGLISAKIQI